MIEDFSAKATIGGDIVVKKKKKTIVPRKLHGMIRKMIYGDLSLTIIPIMEKRNISVRHIVWKKQ